MRRLVLVLIALTLTAAAVNADWKPQAFSSEDTLEFLTVEDGAEHWSTVWLVVIDGQVYIRLGSRAAGRIEANATKPYVKVRIAGQTFDKVKAAKGDKKAFDRVVLSVTGNTERARNLMRNYFKRVEWANYYFTSYKEGWKTDRGMIYILFGLPEEVYKFSDREVWNFKSPSLKVTFTFVKSSTLFDPDNYVLIREKKFQETWYEKVDLWRNARF